MSQRNGSLKFDKPILDLTKPTHSYLFGFLCGDGSLSLSTRNRGKLQIELNSRDSLILQAFHKMLPVYSSICSRQRTTNFKDGYSTCSWNVCNLQLRQELVKLGLPTGTKHLKIKPPNKPFQKADFWRGLVDTDGSIGFTKAGDPFISLCTSSTAIAKSYEGLIKELTGIEKHTNRNTRDSAYNIMLQWEPAQIMAHYLYYDDCLALPRKHSEVPGVLCWCRSKDKNTQYSTQLISQAQDIPCLSRKSYNLEKTLCYKFAKKRVVFPQPGSQMFWTEERIAQELNNFCKNMSVWPTEKDFRKAKKMDLLSAVNAYGGTLLWSTKLEIPREHRQAEEWTEGEDEIILQKPLRQAVAILGLSRNQVRHRREILIKNRR